MTPTPRHTPQRSGVRCGGWCALAGLLLYGTASAVSLTGQVRDAATGAPLAGATVVALQAPAESVHTDTQGRFTLSLPALPAAIGARAPGYRQASMPVQAGSATARLVLQPFQPRAVYLSVYGIGSVALRDAALALRERTMINALVIDTKGDRGMTPYRSAARDAIGASAQVGDGAPQATDLGERLAALHRQGWYLIARIVVFKDEPLARAHPEWSVRDAAGNPWHDREGLQWIDPFAQAAWSHNLDVAEEAARLGFDEIQFDYVRFPDASDVRLRAPNTREARVAAITGFLKAARRRLDPYNVYVAADIFGYVCWNLDDTQIGQQIEQLGIPLDYISPMLYPSGFTWGLPGCRRPTDDPGQIVARSLEEAKRRTGLPGARFRPWLQAFRDYAFDHKEFGAEQIRAQTKAADQAGSNGWMLWNPRNQYDAQALPQR